MTTLRWSKASLWSMKIGSTLKWSNSSTLEKVGRNPSDLTGRISTDGFLRADSPSYPAIHGWLFTTEPFLGQTGEVAENSSWSIVISSVDELLHFSGTSSRFSSKFSFRFGLDAGVCTRNLSCVSTRVWPRCSSVWKIASASLGPCEFKT